LGYRAAQNFQAEARILRPPLFLFRMSAPEDSCIGFWLAMPDRRVEHFRSFYKPKPAFMRFFLKKPPPVAAIKKPA
jgi:hypothetical protein